MQKDREPDAQIIDAARADPAELHSLLEEAMGPAAADFVTQHADWVYREGCDGSERRVVLSQGVVAAYSGRIPVACLCGGVEVPAVWGVHLFVRARFRGRGFAKFCSGYPKDDGRLFLWCPNVAGTAVLTKLGYSLRDDLRVLRVPLRPREILTVRAASGVRGAALRAGALTLAPFAAGFRASAGRYVPKATVVADSPDPVVLEQIFRTWATDDLVTTVRRAELLRWRYLEAPYREELAFYLAGPPDQPAYYAIVRYMPHADGAKARILDLFGDFSDSDSLVDLLRTIVRDAVLMGAAFLEMLSCWPGLTHAARRAGLVLTERRRFMWACSPTALSDHISTTRIHWTMGDGDIERLE